MNIKVANRLVELRKKNGYSQEQLAFKLGVSRQAVSKWERAEASPDTDNLICLAKLYNVSLDDLLDTDQSIDDIVMENKQSEEDKEEEEKNNEIKINGDDNSEIKVTSNGVFIKSGNSTITVNGSSLEDLDKLDELDKLDQDAEVKASPKFKLINAIVSSSAFLIALTVYLILGFLLNDNRGWAIGWPIFLIAAVIPSIFEAVLKKKFCAFLFPLLITAIYCFLGMYLGYWHPYWVLFLSIPVYYIVMDPVDKYLHKN